MADALRLSTRRRQLIEADLLDLDDALRHWYLLAAEQEFNPPLPTIVNTDGEPFAPTTLHFEVRCTPVEAFAALRPLDVCAGDDMEALIDPERDPEGRLTAFSLTWNKRGNRRHNDWDNTILGHIDVRGAALTATVNSNRRADRLRKQIEKRLGARAAFVRAVIDSADHLLRDAHERALHGADDPRTAPAPEIDPDALKEFMQRHWENWLDERVPALRNQTPRQAARTAAGRTRLEALLQEFEWRGGAPVQRLRDALKL